MNAGEMLTNTARSYPDRLGFVWEGGRRTYGESNRRADALAFGLRHGNDNMAPGGPAWWEAYGIASSGRPVTQPDAEQARGQSRILQRRSMRL